MYSDITLLFCTCEKNRHLWGPFFEMLHLYYPEFSGSIIANVPGEIKTPFGVCLGIKEAKKERDFSTRTRLALRAISTPYVWVMLDDYFLFKKPNIVLLKSAKHYLDTHPECGYVNLTERAKTIPLSFPAPDNHNIRVFWKNDSLASLAASIWRRGFFYSLLRKGETAWEFEGYGSLRLRNRKNHRTVAMLDPSLPWSLPYPVGGIVTRGSIDRQVLPLLKQHNLLFLLDYYPVSVRADQINQRPLQPTPPTFTLKLKRRLVSAYLRIYLYVSPWLTFIRFHKFWAD